MNITAICAVVFYMFMAVRGYKKGFVRMVASVACALVSLIAARIFAPVLAQSFLENADFVRWTEENILPNVKGVTPELVASGVTFVILFVILLAASKFAAALLKKIAELPVISFLNHLAGGAFGVIEATMYLWIFMLAATLLQKFGFFQTILTQIANSEFLRILYQNDPFLSLIKSI